MVSSRFLAKIIAKHRDKSTIAVDSRVIYRSIHRQDEQDLMTLGAHYWVTTNLECTDKWKHALNDKIHLISTWRTMNKPYVTVDLLETEECLLLLFIKVGILNNLAEELSPQSRIDCHIDID